MRGEKRRRRAKKVGGWRRGKPGTQANVGKRNTSNVATVSRVDVRMKGFIRLPPFSDAENPDGLEMQRRSDIGQGERVRYPARYEK